MDIQAARCGKSQLAEYLAQLLHVYPYICILNYLRIISIYLPIRETVPSGYVHCRCIFVNLQQVLHMFNIILVSLK